MWNAYGEVALERHQHHDLTRVGDVQNVEERVKLAHKVGGDFAYLQLVVAVDRYEKRATEQVGLGQMINKKRDCLILFYLLAVDHEDETISDQTNKACYNVLQDYNQFCCMMHIDCLCNKKKI